MAARALVRGPPAAAPPPPGGATRRSPRPASAAWRAWRAVVVALSLEPPPPAAALYPRVVGPKVGEHPYAWAWPQAATRHVQSGSAAPVQAVCPSLDAGGGASLDAAPILVNNLLHTWNVPRGPGDGRAAAWLRRSRLRRAGSARRRPRTRRRAAGTPATGSPPTRGIAARIPSLATSARCLTLGTSHAEQRKGGGGGGGVRRPRPRE
jgi:hypothetical protein